MNGTKEQNLIDTLAIRSMSKAKYSTDIGHYGLAFDYYSHFTSPIRRYPDVMVHRLLQYYLDGGKSADQELYETKCLHSSTMEGLATSAERFYQIHAGTCKIIKIKSFRCYFCNRMGIL
jgi:ribonuclease R